MSSADPLNGSANYRFSFPYYSPRDLGIHQYSKFRLVTAQTFKNRLSKAREEENEIREIAHDFSGSRYAVIGKNGTSELIYAFIEKGLNFDYTSLTEEEASRLEMYHDKKREEARGYFPRLKK